MKTKNLQKKLELSKTTVANLENSEMKALKGGDPSHLTVQHYESCPCL